MNTQPQLQNLSPTQQSQVTPEVAQTIGALLDPTTHDLIREFSKLKASGEEPQRLLALGYVLRTRAPLLPIFV